MNNDDNNNNDVNNNDDKDYDNNNNDTDNNNTTCRVNKCFRVDVEFICVAICCCFVLFFQKGSISFDPGLTCTDPDSGDSVTYDLHPSNFSDRFWVDSTTGVFTFNTDYDVDNSNMPSSVVMTVNCIDSGHIDGVSLTGTAQVTVTIEVSSLSRNWNYP
jgi:hypothetical protein